MHTLNNVPLSWLHNYATFLQDEADYFKKVGEDEIALEWQDQADDVHSFIKNQLPLWNGSE